MALQEYKYHVNVTEPTSVYFVAVNARSNANPALGKGLYVYSLSWTPGAGDATGITTIENKKADDDTYYNLQGMRVAAPKKGIFIRNGKKIVLK